MASPSPLSGFRPVMVELMACLQHGTPTFVMSRSDNDFECSERVGVAFTTQSRPTFFWHDASFWTVSKKIFSGKIARGIRSVGLAGPGCLNIYIIVWQKILTCFTILVLVSHNSSILFVTIFIVQQLLYEWHFTSPSHFITGLISAW